MIGGALLAGGSFGYAYGPLLMGVDFPSPAILLPLLIMSAGFVMLSKSIIRTGAWASWYDVFPIAIAAVPLLWLASLVFVGVFLRSRMSDKVASNFFEASFTGLIVLVGLVWMLQAFALRSVSRQNGTHQ